MKDILTVFTQGGSEAGKTTEQLKFFVGDVQLDGVVEAKINEFKRDEIITATIKVNVRLGKDEPIKRP